VIDTFTGRWSHERNSGQTSLHEALLIAFEYGIPTKATSTYARITRKTQVQNEAVKGTLGVSKVLHTGIWVGKVTKET
jgi:hypothetical protein